MSSCVKGSSARFGGHLVDIKVPGTLPDRRNLDRMRNSNCGILAPLKSTGRISGRVAPKDNLGLTLAVTVFVDQYNRWSICRSCVMATVPYTQEVTSDKVRKSLGLPGWNPPDYLQTDSNTSSLPTSSDTEGK